MFSLLLQCDFVFAFSSGVKLVSDTSLQGVDVTEEKRARIYCDFAPINSFFTDKTRNERQSLKRVFVEDESTTSVETQPTQAATESESDSTSNAI